MTLLKSLYKLLSGKYQTVHYEYITKLKPRYGHGYPPHAHLLEIISKGNHQYAETLKGFLTYKDDFVEIPYDFDSKTDSKVHWNNGYLPGLDIIALYSLIAKRKPNRYVEIGSGNSTKVAAMAKAKYNPTMEIMSIDPYPRAEIDDLSDRVIREPFENVNQSFIEELGEGDILFIDNSHRVMPNSDAMVFFMEVLPKLSTGVIVHIHDIYLPYDYPQFMCDRVYNEQYLLAAFIMSNPERYKTIMPCYHIFENKGLLQIIDPIWQAINEPRVERHGGSYWMQMS
jgi:hypothetical protein